MTDKHNELDFAALNLHDGVLKELTLDWQAQTCELKLTIFLSWPAPAQPCSLVWRGVTHLTIPREDPWGPSVYINTSSREGRAFFIEMQSGDTISIVAETVELIQHSLAED